jgi:tetratricopeptide (TPR) repeat protein
LVSLQAYSQRNKRGNGEIDSKKLREAEFLFTEGEKFFILEDYSKALHYYQKALEYNPTNGTIYYKIAEVLNTTSKQDDRLKASLSIESAIKYDKKNKYFYLLAIDIYNNLTRFDKSAQMYEQLLSEVEGSEEYLFELAQIYEFGNKNAEAIETYTRAEEFFGVNETSSIQKLRLYFESGKQKEAIAEGEKLLSAFPGDERFIMGFTEVLSQQKLQLKAIQYLEQFIKENPETSQPKILLAGLYRDNGQEALAREILPGIFEDPKVELSSKLIILGTYSTEINRAKAANRDEEDKAAFAISLFEILDKQNPGNPSVFIIGGDLYLSSGKNKEAVEAYLKAVDGGEVNFEVWQNVLYLLTQLNQYDRVIKYADEALELFPNQSMLYYFNGYANLRKQQFKNAAVNLEQAKKLSTSNQTLVAEINSMLGEAYNGSKEYAKSDKAFEDALAQNANNPTVLNNYSYYLAIRKDNLEKAEKMAALLIKNNPDNATFLDTYAWVLFERKKYKDAKKIIERAIETGGASSTHFEHYGDILFQLGDVDGAVQQWEKARSLNANSEILLKKIANRKIYE